jgi:hypothetical protein
MCWTACEFSGQIFDEKLRWLRNKIFNKLYGASGSLSYCYITRITTKAKNALVTIAPEGVKRARGRWLGGNASNFASSDQHRRGVKNNTATASGADCDLVLFCALAESFSGTTNHKEKA